MTAAVRAVPCRSCPALVYWVITTSGKRMPIDAEPTADGNVTVQRDETGTPIATVHAVGTPLEGPRWTSHFATCARAADHRKRDQPAQPAAVPPAAALEAAPAERRPDWAPCAGCGHQTLNPRHGQPRCPGCQDPLPAGITRVETR